MKRIPVPKHIRDKLKEDLERQIAEANHLHCDRCGQDFYCNDAGWGHYRSCPARQTPTDCRRLPG